MKSHKQILSIIILLLSLSLITMPIVALADESTPPVDGNSQDTPCEAKEGEIYVELNEALGSTKCIKGKTGIDFIKNYISQIYVYGAGLVGLIAVFSIVIGGIQLILRGEEDNSAVKDRIFKSFIGIAILFLSALILYTLNPTFYVLE